MMLRRLAALTTAAVLALGAAACGSGDDDSKTGSGGGKDQTLTVFAAASLTKTFTDLGKEFEAQHKGVKVRFSFGGSSDLVTQIQSGAPADVFASADEANMAKLDDDAQDPKTFATNTLEIAVPPGNPAKISSFADLAKPGVKVVVCAAEVPCGAATQKVEEATKITLKPVSEEQAVTDVLGKVSSGEADAGLVYVTDVKGAGDDVQGVDFPESTNAVNTYPIATLDDAKHEELAQQFVDLVIGAKGQKALADAGFGAP